MNTSVYNSVYIATYTSKKMPRYLSSPAVSSGHAETAAVVGGVTVAVIVTVAVTVIVVVALFRLCCGLPARTAVQYVPIALMYMYVSQCYQSVFLCTGGPSVH